MTGLRSAFLGRPSLFAIAAGIALAWTFVLSAQALAEVALAVLADEPATGQLPSLVPAGDAPYTVTIRGNNVYVGDLLRNAIAFLMTLGAVAVVVRRERSV